MKVIKVKIENLKSIKNLEINLPFQKGVYLICGENGLGKSTFFSALSRLVYKGALTSYFKNIGNSETRITFQLEDKVDEWVKKPNWQRENHKNDEIFIKGFYEGSFIFGNRFSDANKNLLSKIHQLQKNPNDLTEADSFIIENLGYILKDNQSYYNSLKKIKYKNKSEEYGFKNTPYFWEINNELIFQMSMSSGEYLLINLLHFIYEKISYLKRHNQNELSLILLDEIELALHPSAQIRLLEFLNNQAENNNLCVYCATHSTQIINKIKPNNIFYLENLPNSEVAIRNPCYPAYITRDMYTNDGFDYILLVEDRLAKLVVEKTIKNIQSQNKYKLINIIPCGGWEKTLELQSYFSKNKIAGENCKIISILELDIKDKAKRKNANLPKTFLPIDSVEKYLKKYLTDDTSFNQSLYDEISNIYISRGLKDILSDYKKNFPSDNDGKRLYTMLQSCASDIDIDINKFNDEICTIILEHIDCSAFESTLKGLLEL